MIDYSTVKLYLLDNWLEALLVGLLLLGAAGIIYYNQLQFGEREQFLERVDAVRQEEWAPPEAPPATPGKIYNRMIVVDPQLEIFMREEIPPVHYWGEDINVLGVKIPEITLRDASSYVGPAQ